MISGFTFITSAEKTDVGLRRKNNEDSLISLPEYGVYCVADGMGGVRDGEVASQAVVDTLEESFVAGPDSAYAVTAKASAALVARAFNKASQWVEHRSQELGIQGCGSTAIAIVFEKVMPDRAIVLHAGDSRAYRFRNKKLVQLSTDHSVAAEAGIADERELPPMLRGVITRAIGLQPTVNVEMTPVDVKAGDIFVLCSDGLSRMLSDKKISAVIKSNFTKSNQEIVDALVANALSAGGKDNVSVILMRIADKLPAGPLMAIPVETLALEAIELPMTEQPADDEGGSPTGETHDTPFHADGAMVECSTPASDSEESEMVAPVNALCAGAVEAKRTWPKRVVVLLLLAAVVLTVAVAVVIYFEKR